MIVYIFGNGNISFDDFIKFYQRPLLELIQDKNNSFIVCDFRGTDTITMELLKNLTQNVSVYHIGERPRYSPDNYKTKASQWRFVGGFSTDQERDFAAIAECSHFLAIDFNSNEKRTSGTLNNIKNCLKNNKKDILDKTY
jgi:hypothetical protein